MPADPVASSLGATQATAVVTHAKASADLRPASRLEGHADPPDDKGRRRQEAPIAKGLWERTVLPGGRLACTGKCVRGRLQGGSSPLGALGQQPR